MAYPDVIASEHYEGYDDRLRIIDTVPLVNILSFRLLFTSVEIV